MQEITTHRIRFDSELNDHETRKLDGKIEPTKRSEDKRRTISVAKTTKGAAKRETQRRTVIDEKSAAGAVAQQLESENDKPVSKNKTSALLIFLLN